MSDLVLRLRTYRHKDAQAAAARIEALEAALKQISEMNVAHDSTADRMRQIAISALGIHLSAPKV